MQPKPDQPVGERGRERSILGAMMFLLVLNGLTALVGSIYLIVPQAQEAMATAQPVIAVPVGALASVSQTAHAFPWVFLPGAMVLALLLVLFETEVRLRIARLTSYAFLLLVEGGFLGTLAYLMRDRLPELARNLLGG